MTTLTRRGLIRQTALSSAAGALLVAPSHVFAETGSAAGTIMTRTPADSPHLDVHEPIGAYVQDVASGEITLLLGSRELTIRDPDLVRRLILAAR